MQTVDNRIYPILRGDNEPEELSVWILFESELPLICGMIYTANIHECGYAFTTFYGLE
ncbi:hypothetical protein [Paenibacillus sp. GCM10028914]|uniref:hypothetical protein n=1 Tax=Paenibacillus sp. GCM10028914 TaxID=3273416 RepID=UPI003623C69F